MSAGGSLAISEIRVNKYTGPRDGECILVDINSPDLLETQAISLLPIRRLDNATKPVDYAWNPVEETFALKLSGSSDGSTYIRFVLDLSIPTDKTINNLTFISAKSAAELHRLLTRQFFDNPNIQDEDNVNHLGDFDHTSNHLLEYLWQPPPPASEFGSFFVLCFAEYNKRLNALSTLITLNVYIDIDLDFPSPLDSWPQPCINPSSSMCYTDDSTLSSSTQPCPVPRNKSTHSDALESSLGPTSMATILTPTDNSGQLQHSTLISSPHVRPLRPIAIDHPHPVSQNALFSPTERSAVLSPPPLKNDRVVSVSATKDKISVARPEKSQDQPEDGPLFRATIAELEKKTSNLKVSIKKLLKRSMALFDQERELIATQVLFLQALYEIADTDVPSFRLLVSNYFQQSLLVQYLDQSSRDVQTYLIRPLQALYEREIKLFELRKREFDDESSQYYSWLSRYLSMKQEANGKKKSEGDSKYLEKRKVFELSRFDYYSYMTDLHGGRKQQMISYNLALYAESEVNRLVSVSETLTSSVKPRLDIVVDDFKDANTEWMMQRRHREEQRRALETFMDHHNQPDDPSDSTSQGLSSSHAYTLSTTSITNATPGEILALQQLGDSNTNLSHKQIVDNTEDTNTAHKSLSQSSSSSVPATPSNSKDKAVLKKQDISGRTDPGDLSVSKYGTRSNSIAKQPKLRLSTSHFSVAGGTASSSVSPTSILSAAATAVKPSHQLKRTTSLGPIAHQKSLRSLASTRPSDSEQVPFISSVKSNAIPIASSTGSTAPSGFLTKLDGAAEEAVNRKEGLLWAMSRPGAHGDTLSNLNKIGWHKYWIVMDGGRLSEYTNWKQGLEKHNEPIDLKMASVREARNADRRFCFEVLTPLYKRVYQSTSEEDMQAWIRSINLGISSSIEEDEPKKSSSRGPSVAGVSAATVSKASENDHSTASDTNNSSTEAQHSEAVLANDLPFDELQLSLLSLVRSKPSNLSCADCGLSQKVEWISLNLMVVLCIDCSGVHRSLGSHISKVRSLTLDTVSFNRHVVRIMRDVDNQLINGIWEGSLSDKKALNVSENRVQFISEKYVGKKYMKELDKPNASLRVAVANQDLPGVLAALASRANSNALSSVPSEHSDSEESVLIYSLRTAPPGTTTFAIPELLLLNSATLPSMKSSCISQLGPEARNYLMSKVAKDVKADDSTTSSSASPPTPGPSGNTSHLSGPSLERKNTTSKFQKRLSGLKS